MLLTWQDADAYLLAAQLSMTSAVTMAPVYCVTDMTGCWCLPISSTAFNDKFLYYNFHCLSLRPSVDGMVSRALPQFVLEFQFQISYTHFLCHCLETIFWALKNLLLCLIFPVLLHLHGQYAVWNIKMQWSEVNWSLMYANQTKYWYRLGISYYIIDL